MKPFFSFHRLLFPCGLAVVASLSAFAAGGAGGPKTFPDFAKSAVSGAAVPAGLSEPLRALWHAKAGNWDQAHEIAQSIQTETGSWIHAFLHREEGDRSNAGYWYLRAGKAMPADVPLAEEWSVIARELWRGERGIAPGLEAVTSRSGQVATCEKPADGGEGEWDTLIRTNGKLVLRIPHARPVSFSPSGDILLLIEAAADDDGRHFLVKPLANAEIPAFGQRNRIGGRHVTGHKWSEDGRSLTLTSAPDQGGTPAEEITVAEHLPKTGGDSKPVGK